MRKGNAMTMSRALIGLAMLAGLCALPAAAQPVYPSKPVRMIVGYAPGGGTDLAARYVANALSELWGSTVLVDNRVGGGGVSGADMTAKSAPDGYTIMLCAV